MPEQIIKIPSDAIKRIGLYYRIIMDAQEVISSEQLSELTGLGAAQIRKDLTYFGQFGTPGKGYKVDQLKKELAQILGINRPWDVALVGIGNLGKALVSYQGFKNQGFQMSLIFDNNPSKIGQEYQGVPIRSTAELGEALKTKNIQMAVIAVPAEEGPSVANQLIEGGIKAILNFAPCCLKVPKNVKLINIDMAIEFSRLSYYLTQATEHTIDEENENILLKKEVIT
ncbi:MAG: redox-sensing transcriptional repressor Rex [Planctomycetota bacterium]